MINSTTLRLVLLTSLLATACSEYDLKGEEDPEEVSGPAILVTPQELVWGLQNFGDTEIQTFAVQNIGTDTLEVAATNIEGSQAFTVVNIGFPLSLAPDETINVSVAYTPESEDDIAATAWVLSNDPENPEVPVELAGTAGTPMLQLDPEAWDFGEIPIACDGSLRVTMTNVGTATLTIDGISELGAGFELGDMPELPLDLAPGESDTVQVVYRPDTISSFAGELTVSSNDPEGERLSTHVGSAIESGTCLPIDEGDDGEYELSFTAEYRYADVAFLLDTTGSMSGLANAMASEFSAIAASISGIISDTTFGVATYDDYAYSYFGSAGLDLPFILRQQQTSDLSAVQSVLSTIPIHSGGDTEESTLEALYQAATGMGYDQNCSGTYDSSTDVKPFIADASDSFNGTVTGIYNSAVTGTGELGGMGFRDGTLPIIIYATDAPFRDPEGGYPVPNGCNDDAAMSTAVAALNAINARTIGIGVGSTWGSYYITSQFQQVATGTGSYGDMNGDGTTEAAFVAWSGASSTFRNIVVDAVQGLVEGAVFEQIRLDIYGDDLGVVESVDPEYYENVASGDVTDFTVNLHGTAVEGPGTDVYELELVLVGVLPTGGELILDRQELYVMVNGT